MKWNGMFNWLQAYGMFARNRHAVYFEQFGIPELFPDVFLDDSERLNKVLQLY
jgi:hypothetical protein